ncbi:hypothetical protein KM043_014206 [Ampulex compressa]|nr:hypothetical protein KM043_014206 [Ampulex compressa]
MRGEERQRSVEEDNRREGGREEAARFCLRGGRGGEEQSCAQHSRLLNPWCSRSNSTDTNVPSRNDAGVTRDGRAKAANLANFVITPCFPTRQEESKG